MPSEKYYYFHTGADFENLKIRGLCCVLELPQNWPSSEAIQYLHLRDMQDQKSLVQRYDHAEPSTRWTFAYRLNLPVAETVFVDIDRTSAATTDVVELSNSVLRFLNNHLPQDRTVMVPVSDPIWQGVATPASPWPPDFDTLKPVLKQREQGSTIMALVVGLVVLLFLAFVSQMVRPGAAVDPSSWQVAPQPLPTPVPLFQSTPYPTKPPCLTGCITDPSNICPFTVIKGMAKPGSQPLYYEPAHREYGQQNVNPRAGDRWFCTIQEAANNGFMPAPP